MDPAGDEDRVEPHPCGPEEVRLQAVSDCQDLILRWVAGKMKRVAVDGLVRFAVPGHVAAEHGVKVGDGSRTGLWHAAPDHQAVRIEAMHADVALDPAAASV